ncbi:MAG: DUF2271 domain-containing protein [Gemmatimonadales bacterium]
MLRLGFLASLIFAPGVPGAVHSPHASSFTFRRDGVLGTSLDLTFVTASSAEARRAETVALAEIERIRRLTSTWDSTSEVSRLQLAGRLDVASPELRDMLNLYQVWGERTGGAYTAQIGALTSLWKEAEARGELPATEAITALVGALRQPAWQIDQRRGAIEMLRPARLDLNSLGKGYIVDHAMKAVREQVPGVIGGLINIGGDIRTWGEAPAGAATWHIGVTDPRRNADNAPSLTELRVGTAAVSTSGGYARGYTIAGRHYSHIIDARTGIPVNRVLGVTVIAADNATANALATSLSVLDPVEGLALVRSVPGAECLIVTAAGETIRSSGFAAYELPGREHAAPTPTRAVQATMAVDVTPANWNRHRPYLAAWVSDTAGKHLRTLALWGDRPKYLRELSKWYGLDTSSPELVNAVARATRPAGKYTIEWDGLDQANTPVAAGAYLFWLEVAFENGAHSLRSVVVSCESAPATGIMSATDAFAGAQIDCGFKK